MESAKFPQTRFENSDMLTCNKKELYNNELIKYYNCIKYTINKNRNYKT